MANEMITRIQKWPPHKTANIIQELPKNFVTWKEKTNRLLGITRTKKIQEHIELLSGVLHNWSYETNIENEAIESVREELSELLEYWQNELNLTATFKTEDKPENKTKSSLSLQQIALYHAYENNPITRVSGDGIAKQYSHNSGGKLYQHFSFYYSAANRKGEPSNCTAKKLKNKISLIESVIPMLSQKNKYKANDEVKILKDILETKYQ